MKLVTCILIVQLSSLCHALQNSSTQTDPSDFLRRAEGNNTITREEFNSDPYVHRLSGKCIFMLRMPGNRSGDVVALSAESTDMLVEQMCQDLACGSVYHVNKSNSPPKKPTTCFHDCVYQDGRLQNCLQSAGDNCTVIAEAVCGHQAVRLAGGSDRCAGRVELWRKGRWGTVCDDQWDLRDADVVCAQLGCGYALSVTGQGGLFPPGRGPVHLDDLNCAGVEETLWACPAAQDEPDCGHKEDAGVVCSEMRAVRLTGGLDRCSGKVEVHRNGSWGTVCDNCWNKDMASMVCSMLQCGAEPLKYSQFVPYLTHNNGTLWFYQCDPNVLSLWECTELINKPHLCSTSKASGVICNGSLGFPAATTDTTENATVMTSWTTGAASVSHAQGFLLPSPELLSTIALALILLVVFIIYTVVCCHYRKRHAFLLQETRTGPRPLAEYHHNSHQDAVDLVKITPNTANPLQTEDSQRYRTDVNPLMKPSGLDRLLEEAPEATNEVMGAFIGYNGAPAEPQYARVSKISVDSFDTSSTSSGEIYKNTNNGYVMVTPEPGLGQSPAFYPPRLLYSKDQLYSGETMKLQSLGDEDDGPIYSPVSPDQNSSSDDDYDDVGT
ncbi:T-cell differentiation antigen CD6-like isoform X2 [Etheostoma cragini]|uniref:T-cell differentiation antigen CD6-like isoform X2 n=1 Tax=Etheostoma cragini TaxID=417921 RepID=UPI00155EB4B9|nr:T-cell differentiation antigen CD6-like isoform X2 [Etheostoma cragini]